MPQNISKELEKEILSMTTKVKDRYLLRLIAKNDLLREQLQFQLVEEEGSEEERRELLKEDIIDRLSIKNNFVTDLYRITRKSSASITWHRRVTKDIYGEVELNLVLLESVLQNQFTHMLKVTRAHEKLQVYLVKKCIAWLKLLPKLHEDYRIDFIERFNAVLTLIYESKAGVAAAYLQLPKHID